MREESCGSTMPAIIVYLFIYDSLLSVRTGSMRQVSCWSCHYYFLFFVYSLFIIKCLQRQHA
jgi:uncharacterized membrane protein YdjX (TVP38/TMEM64 family)